MRSAKSWDQKTAQQKHQLNKRIKPLSLVCFTAKANRYTTPFFFSLLTTLYSMQGLSSTSRSKPKPPPLAAGSLNQWLPAKSLQLHFRDEDIEAWTVSSLPRSHSYYVVSWDSKPGSLARRPSFASCPTVKSAKLQTFPLPLPRQRRLKDWMRAP